jgi:hypothetical protein
MLLVLEEAAWLMPSKTRLNCSRALEIKQQMNGISDPNYIFVQSVTE